MMLKMSLAEARAKAELLRTQMFQKGAHTAVASFRQFLMN